MPYDTSYNKHHLQGEALTKAQLHAIEFGGPADVDMVDDAGSGGEAEGGSDGEEREENIDSEEEK